MYEDGPVTPVPVVPVPVDLTYTQMCLDVQWAREQLREATAGHDEIVRRAGDAKAAWEKANLVGLAKLWHEMQTGSGRLPAEDVRKAIVFGRLAEDPATTDLYSNMVTTAAAETASKAVHYALQADLSAAQSILRATTQVEAVTGFGHG